jgi:hypothetical protein
VWVPRTPFGPVAELGPSTLLGYLCALRRKATVYPLQVRRRDLLGGLIHEYEAAA